MKSCGYIVCIDFLKKAIPAELILSVRYAELFKIDS
jgi:hypothetical protein